MSRNYLNSEAFRDQVSRDLRSDAEFERRQRENRLTAAAPVTHTPGAWAASADGSDGFAIHHAEHRNMRIATLTINQASAKRTLANAVLIAAAPDLLGAARFALNYLEDHANETSEGDYDAEYAASCDAAVVGLRAAVRKAEGR